MDQIKKFVIEFFKNLKCSVSLDGEVLVVENVPKSFEDLFGKESPYRLGFESGTGAIFVGKGSSLLAAMTKYLEGAGKTTLLKIDFDVDPEKEISKVLSLKNCEISNLVKKHKNNFFSRFTFMTTFRYLNESEQIVNEIYVHNGEVVDGDLGGYNVVEGDSDLSSGEHIGGDYDIAKVFLKGALQDKTSEISKVLGDKVEKEIERINLHYGNLLGELGGDLNGQLEKVKKLELELRMAEDSEKDGLRIRLDRLRKGLVKVGDDNARDKILKEQKFTVKDAMHKHSLGIDNKLVNTTVIYYPVFTFNLLLKGDGTSGRYIDMIYDPLTKSLNQVDCEGCGTRLNVLNLCSGGHICCGNCLRKCGECCEQFCVKCLTRSCSCCGKALCKNCSRMCLGCGKNVCENHMRVDCVSGEDRCVNCLRACMRCHGLSSPKFFGEAMDGSKVCQKCLGAERRGKVVESIFRDRN
ncbi:hypothetical protein HOA55_04195 [archaeon]|jgi:hypothetical protein|nr:hypothetical protein [archaeon]MBT3577926.1 hypothetical protein [archaeon]MBT6820529.1 hypothetical protein [archaeon]MBT6955747.1 hypothetical protein [archaeon]MBT7025779.1 hypothetical protein [archaeon]